MLSFRPLSWSFSTAPSMLAAASIRASRLHSTRTQTNIPNNVTYHPPSRIPSSPVSSPSSPSSTTTPFTNRSTSSSTSIYPFRISRTHSNSLPIYQETKNAGTLKRTRIRRVIGDSVALKKIIIERLGLQESEVLVNSRTQHILVKGHRREKLMELLGELGV